METRAPAPFGAVLTAVLTPFDQDGAVDYATFWRLLRYLAENGSEGVVVAGTTGESPTLSTVEKVAMFKAAVEAVGDRMKVVAGTGTYDTAESVELSERAAEVGVDGLMAVTPYYSKPPQEGLYRHFRAIAESTDLPLMLYNIPGRTARLIEIDTIVQLAGVPQIVAVKDAVDDLEFTRKQLAAVPHDFAVYSGSDHMTREIVKAGGVGVVSVASHLVGNQVRRLVEAAATEDEEEAVRLDDALTPLFDALFVEPNPMPLKAGMGSMWGPVGQPRLPLVPAMPATLKLLEAAMETAHQA
jgi:4-hydroxy-tetrahydrodipicolinate synthase